MLQVNVSVDCADDAARAAALFTYLAQQYGGTAPVVEVAPVTEAGTTRRRRNAAPTVAADPVAAYNALAAATGVRQVPETTTVDATATSTAPAQVEPAASVTPAAEDMAPAIGAAAEPTATAPAQSEPATSAPAADTRSRDELLAEFKPLAQRLGTVWLRGVLTANAARWLSDLSADALREAIARGKADLAAMEAAQ